MRPMTVTTKVAALVAVLALAVPVAGCGRRAADRDRTDSPAGHQETTVTTADPRAAEDALDELDALLGDVESALTEADAAPADED